MERLGGEKCRRQNFVFVAEDGIPRSTLSVSPAIIE